MSVPVPVTVSVPTLMILGIQLLTVRPCLDATVPFYSLIQIILFLPFQNGGKAIFTAETVAQPNSPIFAKQALSIYTLGYSITSGREIYFLPLAIVALGLILTVLLDC